MHDKAIVDSDLQEQWDLASPDGEIAGVMDTKLTGNGGDMVDQAEIFEGEELRGRRWVDVKIWKWENSSLLPTFNVGFDLWSPKQIRLLRSYSSFFLGWHVHVRTTTIMLRTIAALREILVTTYMSTFASLATLAGLCMAPTGRSTTRASHFDEVREKR
jgi:hypothetical protein